ncbi:MAG: phosphoribosylglycinamide formyltransferase [Reyranellaceae bacterium]
MARLKVGVLISGRGSNLAALLDAAGAPGCPYEIVHVVSNVAGAAGLDIAGSHGVTTTVIDHRGFADRAGFDAALDRALRAAGVEFVCLAGFMRLLGDGLVAGWRDRMVNIHPSLLPAFKGRHPQRQALRAGARESGCTVHYVRPAMDSGPIVARAKVPVLAGDDEATLSARILAAEHRLYPLALALIATGDIGVEGERARRSAAADAALGPLENPLNPPSFLAATL